MQSCRTLSPILNQLVASCLVLTVTSWPTYKFLRKQVRCSGTPISDFSSLLWSTVKGFGIVNKAEVDVCLELSCFFSDPMDVGYKESWAPKKLMLLNWVLKKTLESPLNCKEIQPVNPKGDQSWVFIGRTDAEVEIPIFWPPDVKNSLIGKDHDAGQYWRQEEKGMTEDEMVGWHHQLNGHEFEQALGVGDGQGSLACCSPWGRKESDTTEQLN